MSNAIVTVNVSTTSAPLPNMLQQMGAFISQGGTTQAAGTIYGPITTLADLTSILSTSKALSTLAWSASPNIVTGTTSSPHGWTIGDTVQIVIAGATPTGYNGTYAGTVTGTSTFTYPLASNPGSETVPGTVILADESELLTMGTTYFAQSSVVGVYVLELGETTVAEGVTALSAWVTANPNTIYSFLVPREWDAVSSYVAFLGNHTAPNAKQYFFTTTTVANRNVYAALKSTLTQVEAPTIAATEFSLASDFAVTLAQRPSSTQRVTPLSYSYVYGVTAYPAAGNNATFTELNTANVGWIGTGAEGGISNTIIFYGQMADGNPWNYWYSADWIQINMDLALANEVINGSNNSQAPLYYDQSGVDRLQNRAIQVLNQAITNGLANGTVLPTKLSAIQFAANYNAGLYVGYLAINAEPFILNQQENPTNYAQGVYNGLSCVYTPSRGFKQIIFNVNITNLIA